MLADRRGLLPRSEVAFGTWTRLIAACLSFGAAAIHFALVGEHFAEYAPYGVAFAALAWFQVGWAVRSIVRDDRRAATVAIAVNAGALATWAASRFIGLPFGPEPGQVEPVGALDLLAGALEIALIGVLVLDFAAGSIRLRPALSASQATIVVGSGLLAVVVLTSAALATTGGSAHDEAALEVPSLSSSTPAISVDPGLIRFGRSLGLTGEIEQPSGQFGPGQTAVWIADFSEPPDAPTIRLIIDRVLPDGRESEHWRQEIDLADPDGRRLVAMADLSTYVHGGEGSYRMRYFRDEELLAEGAFEFVP